MTDDVRFVYCLVAWFNCSDCLIVLLFSASCCYLIICINGSWISLVEVCVVWMVWLLFIIVMPWFSLLALHNCDLIGYLRLTFVGFT